MRFRPERFLDDDLSNPRKGHLGFGAGAYYLKTLCLLRGFGSFSFIGRRQCVGYNLAATNQFIVFSRLLYCFDIQEDVANPLVVDKPFPLTALAEPYKVFFKPRSEAHRQLIERECKAAASIDTS